MTAIDDEEPLDISLLDAEPKVDALASRVVDVRGCTLDYRKPQPVQEPSPKHMTVKEARLAELRRPFYLLVRIARRVVFAVGVALLTGGFGETFRKQEDGPELMAVGGLLIGLTIPFFIRRAN